MGGYMLVLAALLGASVFASETAKTPTHKDGEHSCSTGESCFVGNDNVELLQSTLAVERICSEADIWGSDSELWPSTLSEAKITQLSYCEERGYDADICRGVIDEHFKEYSSDDGEKPFTMTPHFCKESLELLKLDTVHHAGASSLLQNIGSEETSRGGTSPTSPKVDGPEKKAGCFPSEAAVFVQTQDGTVSTRTMEQLRIGDAVLTQTGFSKIFAFMEHAPDAGAEYVHVKTESGYELSLTADHIVYAHANQRPVLAGSILKGDLLWTLANPIADFAASHVVSVEHKLERGMHAPLTQQGSVVVNGILSSSYAGVRSLHWGNDTLVTGHDLTKYIHEPLRCACDLMPALCGPEWHSEEGRHVWTQFVIDKFGWLWAMNRKHSDIRAALITEPSMVSWLASFVQLTAAAALSIVFGHTSHIIALLGAVVAINAVARQGKVAKIA